MSQSTAASPLALPFPEMPPINGVTIRTARARYKAWDRADLTYAIAHILGARPMRQAPADPA